MNAKQIAQQLSKQAEDVSRHLLPKGKRVGKAWCVGSIHGEAGDSLKIELSGDKAGVWKDFASSEKGGDLLDLWSAVCQLPLATTLTEAKRFLGIEIISFEPKRTQRFSVPQMQGVPLQSSSQTGKYLITKRGLNEETLQHFKIHQQGNEIVFPYYREDRIFMIKGLSVERSDGKKIIRCLEKNCEPGLFGWQAVPPKAKSIVIAEGEIDAMTLHQYGFSALSVPFGGGAGNKQKWVEFEYENLEHFDEIYLCFDNDETGHAAVEELVTRLGAHRCSVVTLPHKDANECLQNGVSKEEIERCFKEACSFDPEELKSASSYRQQVKSEFYGDSDQESALSLPWDKAKGKIQLRNEELSMWTGINGHGKSQLLGHLVLHAMQQGNSVCIASMELKPKRLLERLARQASTLERPTPDYIDAIHDWYQDKLWIFEMVGTAKTRRLIEVFTYARKRYGINFFVIDSLMKCGIAEDDYNAQKKFVEELCDFKNEYSCQVHLVVHPRKGMDETKIPGKLDIKGTGALADLADNCFCVWRNKSKEQKIQAHESKKAAVDKELLRQMDCLLTCDKQRNGEWEGKMGLWFDKQSFQYLNYQEQKPKRYVEFSNCPAETNTGKEKI